MANPIEVLNDLEDVDVPDPDDGDILYYDEASGLWKGKQPAVGGGTVERLVRASADDCSVHWNGSAWVFSLTWNYFWAGRFSAGYEKIGSAGLFRNIYIPKDATITHAYLKPTARDSDASLLVKTRIRGEKNDSPIAFSNYADYDARTRTTAVVDWDDIATWVLGTLYSSPDIKTIIKEIVALAGWVSGNPLVIFWDDHEARTATDIARLRRGRDWNHGLRTPPMLYIEWVAGGSGRRWPPKDKD
ncbi:hypothetical protein ES703_59886 [subsurface metagenome]